MTEVRGRSPSPQSGPRAPALRLPSPGLPASREPVALHSPMTVFATPSFNPSAVWSGPPVLASPGPMLQGRASLRSLHGDQAGCSSPAPAELGRGCPSQPRLQSPSIVASRSMRSLSPPAVMPAMAVPLPLQERAAPRPSGPIGDCPEGRNTVREPITGQRAGHVLGPSSPRAQSFVASPARLDSPQGSRFARPTSPAAAWAWGGVPVASVVPAQQPGTPVQHSQLLTPVLSHQVLVHPNRMNLGTTPRHVVRGARAVVRTSAVIGAGQEASSCSSARPAPQRHLQEPSPGSAEEHSAVLERLKVLLSDPELVASSLESCFEAVGGGRDAPVPMGAAVSALCTAHTMLLPGLPSTCISEVKWRSLLKRAGAYNSGDEVSLDQLREVQAQTLGTLRDVFAPKELLRSMRQVPSSVPRLKDRYESFEFRAKGALGKVYRCRDLRTQEILECRQIRKDKASAPMDFIRTSLQRITELRHANLPRVLDCLEDFHNVFIISEPVDGVEVMDFIQGSFVRGGGISEAQVADLVRQVLEAAVYCHSQPLGPVVHRDLQPEFVVVEEEADSEPGSARQSLKAYVSGFGLQPLFDLHGLGGSLPSSCLPAGPSEWPGLAPESMPSSTMPEFLAPEVWSRNFGPKCDVWSIGCLMFLLLTGRAPFPPRRSLRDLVLAATEEEPDWRLFRSASTAALSLCKRMLDKDDAARPSAAQCLRHPWLSTHGPAAERPPEMPLIPETFGALMQSHAQSKFHQVLMNVVATEIKIGRLWRVREAFAAADPTGSGYVASSSLEVALKELAVSAQTAEQALRALDATGTGQIPYTLFVAGCVDLVDDKLDHMLWKVFSMVDEDHSGQIETLVLEHFLSAALGDSQAEEEGGTGGSLSSSSRERASPASRSRSGGVGDVERYIRSILDPSLTARDATARIAGDRKKVNFEEVKQFILTAANEQREQVLEDEADETSDGPLLMERVGPPAQEEASSEAAALTDDSPASAAAALAAAAAASRDEELEKAKANVRFGHLPDLPTFKGSGSKKPSTGGTPMRRERIKSRLVTNTSPPRLGRKTMF
eukprot:TRINITY_DN33357_c0_g1_i1.p1 TRINITY_DN33357_c0_g1~~TRINITY_DN33357_c0_g1_i1.p1  ORF type:complete len:1061 (+),score=215.07 TRINITY_DN33357_c0_g1_i1:59-3241(+)